MIGAGPAGLAAALTAAERGHDVVVFEAAEAVGGMAGSFEVAGLRVDHGSHRLHASTSPEFLRRLSDLLGNDLQARERNGRIRLRDRWVAFPLRLTDMARRLPPTFGARAGVEALAGPLRRGSGPAGGFLDEVARRLGPTVTDEFYRPYGAKLYGVEPEELTAELARRRVSTSSPFEILAKAARAGRTNGRLFYYPRRGYGQVSEALAEAALAAGVEIRLGEPVTRVMAGPNPTILSSSATAEVDLIASTMPLPALASALEPAVEPPVAAAVSALRTRSMVLVYLVVPRGAYTPYDAHYFPSPDISICRLSEPKNYRDGDDPAGLTVLCAELACWAGDEIWSADNAELGDRLAADLARAGLPDTDHTDVVVRRLPSVYPVYERATEQARAVVEQWLAGIPGVLSFGRQGLGVPDNLHHVLDMGVAAGSSFGPDGVDRDAWARSLQAFAANVVVD